ncbi:MAG: RNA polymerase Rpb4 family protein [Candidatus Undinarchaeales archaeon]
MIGKRLLGQEPVTMTEVKQLIKDRKKNGELSYEQNLVLEACNKFSKLSKKEAEKFVKDITEIEKLNKEHAVMLSYILPKTEDEVKILFSKEHFILSGEEIKKILEILNNYSEGKKKE